MGKLGDLPLDIIVCIANHLPCNRDRVNLALTSRELYRAICHGHQGGWPSVNPGEDDSRQLRLACKRGDGELVAKLLRDPRVDPTVRKSICLRDAASVGDVHTVRHLLEDGRVCVGVYRGRPLSLAISHGHHEVALTLLSDERSVHTNALPHYLELIFERGTPELFQRVVELCALSEGVIAQLIKQISRPHTSFRLADIFSVLYWLLTSSRHAKNALEQLELPATLDAVAASNSTHLLETFLLGKFPQVNIFAHDQQLFRTACEHGSTEIVRTLLALDGTDPAILHNHAIQWCASNGNVQTMELLLQDRRVSPAALDNTPLAWAAWQGHVKVVQMLLQHPEVDPCDCNYRPLRLACDENNIDVVVALCRDDRVTPAALRKVLQGQPDDNVEAIRAHPWIREYLSCTDG